MWISHDRLHPHSPWPCQGSSLNIDDGNWGNIANQPHGYHEKIRNQFAKIGQTKQFACPWCKVNAFWKSLNGSHPDTRVGHARFSITPERCQPPLSCCHSWLMTPNWNANSSSDCWWFGPLHSGALHALFFFHNACVGSGHWMLKHFALAVCCNGGEKHLHPDDRPSIGALGCWENKIISILEDLVIWFSFICKYCQEVAVKIHEVLEPIFRPLLPSIMSDPDPCLDWI